MGDWRTGDDCHRRNLPHIDPWARPVFVTFCTSQRWVLPEPVRALVLDHCTRGHGTLFWLHVAVVMPDHVHLLLTPYAPADGLRRPLSRILHGIKGASAHAVNRLLERRGAVWQGESFDRVLRSEESVAAKAAYILGNPVRQGLAPSFAEYPWSWRE